MNELQKTENMAFLLPKTYTEAKELAKDFAKSGMVPKHYENKPEAIVVAWDLGLNLGLGLTQSLQSIYVVNGMPTVWGDAALALVKSSGLLELIDESVPGQCTVKRKGEKSITVNFSMKDAQEAGLTGKTIWKQYPARMLKMRNRAFALRDVFPDVLKGLAIKEEVEDYKTPYPDAIDTRSSAAPIKNVLAETITSITETITDQETGEITEVVTLSTDEMNEMLSLMSEITNLRKEKDSALTEQANKSPVALEVLERMDNVIASGFKDLSLKQLKEQRDFLLKF